MKSIQNIRTGKKIAVVNIAGGIKRALTLIKSGIYVSDNSPLPVSKEVAISVINERLEKINEQESKQEKQVEDGKPKRTRRKKSDL